MHVSSLSVLFFLLKKKYFSFVILKERIFPLKLEIYTKKEFQNMAFTQSLSVSYITKIVEEKSFVSFSVIKPPKLDDPY